MHNRQVREITNSIIGVWAPLTLTLALGSGCTNNFLRFAGGTDPNAYTSPIANNGSLESGLIISRVSKSAVDPSSSFDLVGDGSGAMAQLCFSENGSSIGPSNCQCNYSYILPDGTSNDFSVPTSYHDANLIRCSFLGNPGIPASVSTVNVRVFLTNAQTYSNTIQVKMNGTGTALDLSKPSSFIQAQRYQCRDIVSVPYLFDGNLVDPVLSDDPKISYPLNFYTTNMGGTIARFASMPPENVKRWHCPSLPNDSSSDSGLNLTVYSLGPDENGSKQIFPHKGGFDRSTFHLAKSPTGVFNVPVHAFVAPTITTGTNDLPALGYGAPFVRTSGGGEGCPDNDPSVTIPAGYEWVKVWLFRANLEPREYKISPALYQVGAIGCNPGNLPSGSGPVFDDCRNLASMSDPLNALGYPAARVLMVPQMCVNLRGPMAPCGGHGPGCATSLLEFGRGSDIWQRSPNATAFSCGGANSIDPLNLCSGSPTPVPYTEDLITRTIDMDGERFDFLFVVTPTTVTTDTMKNLSTSASHAYIPYRFRPGDCSSPDPENPTTPGDCDGSKRITYGLKLHDMISNGDPPANNPNRQGIFPVCTIRPKGG